MTAYKKGSQTVFLPRDPAGNLMTYRPSTGTSLCYLVEPNGNVAGATDSFGHLVAAYEHSPYGKSTTVGLGDFNQFRYLSSWQETTSAGEPRQYKLGSSFTTRTAWSLNPTLAGGLSDPRTMTSYNYATGDPINGANPSGDFSLTSGFPCTAQREVVGVGAGSDCDSLRSIGPYASTAKGPGLSITKDTPEGAFPVCSRNAGPVSKSFDVLTQSGGSALSFSFSPVAPWVPTTPPNDRVIRWCCLQFSTVRLVAVARGGLSLW